MKATLLLPHSQHTEIDTTLLQQQLDEYIQVHCSNAPAIQKYGQVACKELCTLVAHVFPNATPQAYSLLLPFVLLLLVLDDLNPDLPPCTNTTPPLFIHYQLLVDQLMDQMQQVMSEWDYQVLRSAWDSLLQLRRGKRNEASMDAMSLKQFCKFRAEDSMAFVGMRVLPLCCGIQLSQEIHSHPLILQLEKIVSKQFCCCSVFLYIYFLTSIL